MQWDKTMKIQALLIVVFVICTCSPGAQDMFNVRRLTLAANYAAYVQTLILINVE